MKNVKIRRLNCFLVQALLALTMVAAPLSTALAQGTAFTYQGQLNSSGGPATGSFDLVFTLYGDATGGSSLAGPVTNTAVAVTNGLFATAVDFGDGKFTGGSNWLSISVRTNGAGALTQLAPRTQLNPTPYAIFAEGANAGGLSGVIPAGNFSGTYGSPVNLDNAANSFSGNGTGLTNVNATLLGGLAVSNFWQTTGNAGTVPGVNFLGTSDNEPLILRADNQVGLQLQYVSSGGVDSFSSGMNIIGGYSGNTISNGVIGGTIAGGGDYSRFGLLGGGVPNVVTGSYGTVGGGNDNTAGFEATVPGGFDNLASGNYSFAAGQSAQALYVGTFVWADSQNGTFASSTSDEFSIRANNGVRIQTSVGVHLNAADEPIIVRDWDVFAPSAPADKAGIGRWGLFMEPTILTLGIPSDDVSPRYFQVAKYNTNGTPTQLAQVDQSGNLGVVGGVNVDQTGTNIGGLYPGLTFGASSGEGIASQRASGSATSGRYGLEFYTDFANRMTILQNGSVGVGTTTPSEALMEVNGDVRLDQNRLLLTSVVGNANDTGNGLEYDPSGLIGVPGGAGPFLFGFNGGALGTSDPNQVSLSWSYTGDVWVSNNLSTASLTIRGGADLAEPFNITAGKGEVPQGAVVVIDEQNPGQLKLTDQPYDTRVAGVVSGANGINPGIQMHQQGLLEGGKNVALSGRVYVQADTSNGAIKPGDLLTTSGTPGRAMRVSDHVRAQGAILGKAMTALKQGQGMVLVLVTLQ
jgi:hypothetical protein